MNVNPVCENCRLDPTRGVAIGGIGDLRKAATCSGAGERYLRVRLQGSSAQRMTGTDGNDVMAVAVPVSRLKQGGCRYSMGRSC